MGVRTPMYAPHRYAVSYDSWEPVSFQMRKRMAAPTKPKIPIMMGRMITEPRPIAIPAPTWKRRTLRIDWRSPATTPMAIINTRGSTNPPVLGISLKNSDGDVSTFIAVCGIVAKSILLPSIAAPFRNAILRIT